MKLIVAFRNFVNAPNRRVDVILQFEGERQGTLFFRNKQYQLDTHFTFHFIMVHSLDMFRALLAHPQEALHKRRVGDCCVLKLITSSCHGEVCIKLVLLITKLRHDETRSTKH
jgi:hypothetical protein